MAASGTRQGRRAYQLSAVSSQHSVEVGGAVDFVFAETEMERVRLDLAAGLADSPRTK